MAKEWNRIEINDFFFNSEWDLRVVRTGVRWEMQTGEATQQRAVRVLLPWQLPLHWSIGARRRLHPSISIHSSRPPEPAHVSSRDREMRQDWRWFWQQSQPGHCSSQIAHFHLDSHMRNIDYINITRIHAQRPTDRLS